jgi:hypothetical protein
MPDRHNPPPSGFRGTVYGFVAEVAWADCSPRRAPP